MQAHGRSTHGIRVTSAATRRIAAVRLTPIALSPCGDNAQVSAARTLSISCAWPTMSAIKGCDRESPAELE